MKSYELDVVVTRGGVIESRHHVHAAVVDADGQLVGSSRDPRRLTHWRSCAKPFQVMPLLASGGFAHSPLPSGSTSHREYRRCP